MLSKHAVDSVYHYVPLHYLPYIIRARVLLSKKRLIEAGFNEAHFRSTSKKQDIDRGFDDCVHLSLENMPRILKAKLNKGFPHFEVSFSGSMFEELDYYLCRFNIAKTRYFRGAKSEPEESPCNGKYQKGRRLPIAITEEEKDALLVCNLGKRMIELLVPSELMMIDRCELRFFSTNDLEIAENALYELCVNYNLSLCDIDERYNRNTNYVNKVESYLRKSLDDPAWFGDGLEFDNV